MSAGALVMLTKRFTDFALDTFIPVLDDMLDTVKIPDYSGEHGGFDLSATDITVNTVDLTDASIDFRPGQALQVIIPMKLDMSANFEAQFAHFPHHPDATGQVTATAKRDTNVALRVTISTDADGKPSVNLGNDPGCKIDLDVTFHGSMYSWLGNLVSWAFGSIINNAICSAITTELQTLQTTMIDPFLADVDMSVDLPLPPVLMAPGFAPALDLRITSNPVITNSDISVTSRMELFDRKRPRPNTAPPPLPQFRTAATHMLSAELSAWSFDRALDTFYQAGVLSYVVQAAIVPPSSPIQLFTNSTFWKITAAGLSKYCPNCEMDMIVAASGPPTLDLAGGDVVLHAPALFTFEVIEPNGTKRPAFSMSSNIVADVILNITDDRTNAGTFHTKFSRISCTASLNSTNVGQVYSQMLAPPLNVLATLVMIPYANNALAGGITIPPIAAPGGNLTLVRPELILDQESVFLDSDLQWRVEP